MHTEDKHSHHLRDEERKMLEDAERRKEAAERQRFAAEEALAAAVRRRDHERREAASMASEDMSSAALREALRLAAEIKGFAAADAESFVWREMCREAAETRQMASEDQHSSLLRLSDSKPVPRFDQQAARTAAPDLSVLAKMVVPGRSQKPEDQYGGFRPRGTRTLDPWDSSDVSESVAKGDRLVKTKEAKTCGSLMCLQLWEGNSRFRGSSGKSLSRRRPAKWSRPDDDRPERVSAALSSEDLGLDGLAAGLEDWGSVADVVRLEIRMEGLEQLPMLSRVPQLRILVLSGNKISSLEALHGCPKLEELVLCQNALTCLDGLRHLRHLSVLKATMNAITDAEDLAQLPQLRVVDLSKNRLASVHLSAKGLGKLVLYRNSLQSAAFLQELPSLTQLDLGRNKLTELDAAISEWNPVLTKAFLYENSLASLPELHLPLLTDLWPRACQHNGAVALCSNPSLPRLDLAACSKRFRQMAAEDFHGEEDAPLTPERVKEFKNSKFQKLVEVYSNGLKPLVQENIRLREELGLDLDTPLDWDSDEDSGGEEHSLQVGSHASAFVERAKSEPARLRSQAQDELESKKSSSFNSDRYQVLPQFLSTPLDKATERQFKATLVQDLRRFSEAVEMQPLGQDERMSCYDLFVNTLSQLRSTASELVLAQVQTRKLHFSGTSWVQALGGLLLIAYDVFAIPLQAFPLDEDVFTESMGWITLCFWTTDMVVSNIVGYFDGPQLVMQQYRITLRYLRTWFVLDAVVVIPDWFTRLAQDFIDSEYLFIVMDILRLLLFIVVLNHVIACLWYLLGYIGYESGDYNWLEYTGYTKVIEGSIAWQYTTALHWSLTQFTPAGMDVFARNVPERIMSVIVLGFAVIIFSSVLASVSASMTALRNLQGDSKKQFWLLRRYLRRKQVTTQSRVRIIKFLEHVVMIQAKTVKSSDVSLLGKLSQPLKELLEYEVHKETVMLHPFFHYLGECVHSLMVKLCAATLAQVQFALQDCIFRAGDLGEHMYFITSGTAKYAYQELHEGDWMAEASLWTQWSHRGLLVISSQPTVLLLLSSQGFGNVMRMSQSSYVLCRRFVFAFVAELNAMESKGEASDMPWDPDIINKMTLESSESSGLAAIRSLACFVGRICVGTHEHCLRLRANHLPGTTVVIILWLEHPSRTCGNQVQCV
ncbi:CNGA3 [Symbiodinium necroappetens]|uniref:CNGA3 protein n=1 Tax=Symbiodinium necroappetens TaxID=1628268 RepID=A0A812IS57_9DINO|nr:CNGA3 [Symbiodinium necroappetens]